MHWLSSTIANIQFCMRKSNDKVKCSNDDSYTFFQIVGLCTMNVYFMHYKVFRGIDCGMHLVEDNNLNEWANNIDLINIKETRASREQLGQRLKS